MDFQSFKLTFVKMNSLTDRRLDQPMNGRTKWLVELRNTRLKTSSPFRHAINGAEKYFFLLFFSFHFHLMFGIAQTGLEIGYEMPMLYLLAFLSCH